MTFLFLEIIFLVTNYSTHSYIKTRATATIVQNTNLICGLKNTVSTSPWIHTAQIDINAVAVKITDFVSADFKINLTAFLIKVTKNPIKVIRAKTPLSTAISRKILYALNAKSVNFSEILVADTNS